MVRCRPRRKVLRSLLLTLLILAAGSAAADPRISPTEEEMSVLRRYLRAPGLVQGGRIEARWLEDGDAFWFEDHRGAHFVDPRRKEMRPLRPGEREGFPPRPETGGVQVHAPGLDRWVTTRDGDLWLHEGGSGEERRLTDDAGEDVRWLASAGAWSPDGRRLFAARMDTSEVHHLPVIDYSDPEETVREVVYSKSGGGFWKLEAAVFDLAGGKVSVDMGPKEDIYLFSIGWREDGSEVLFLRLTREAKRLDLMAADFDTGESRVVVSEETDTFLGGLDFITGGWRAYFTPVAGSDRFLWLSDRDGWRHVYLYDLDGRLVRRLTRGEFPVLSVEAVDPEAGRAFVMANAEDRLYDTHLYRVELSGSGFRRLTEGTGDHRVQLSPSRRFFVDTHSSVHRPPVSELRDADGELLLTLSAADTSALDELGWAPPEEFVVKADDGETDLYGVLYQPADFDPERRYPVIDFIYAGPFITAVPNTYAAPRLAARARAVAQLGYVTLIVDGRGTTERSKAFQDASYGRIGQIEIPDHVAALRQLAAERPYMDLGRVGVHGASWGGYFVLRAMLTAPEVFHVGVAIAPGDLTESQPINEPYMGLPQNNPEGYRAGSNPAAAGNLQGHLLIIHGTADVNAPFSTTMRMVEALVRAGKLHDLAVLPQANHYPDGPAGRYMAMRTVAYFKEHLQGRSDY